LIQLLKKDFDRDLSALEAGLPTDENGVDVAHVMDRVRREVRDIPGFEVVDESALGTFSFAKYLMWKDLVDRSEQLKNNRVVRHLIDSPDQAFEVAGGGGIPEAKKNRSRVRTAGAVPSPAGRFLAIGRGDGGGSGAGLCLGGAAGYG